MNSFLLGPVLTLMYRVAQINMDFSEPIIGNFKNMFEVELNFDEMPGLLTWAGAIGIILSIIII